MLKEGIGNAEVTLRILKIDGIYLMGHCGRAYFPLLYLLLKIIHGDIAPDIPAKIDQDRIDTFDGIEMSGQVVIMFYLRRVLLALQAQRALHKLIAQFSPVFFRESHIMGIEIPGGAPELGRKRHLYQLLYLDFDPFSKGHELLPQPSRAGRLTM